MSSERLLSSRYASCTPGVLDLCVRAVAGGEDLDDVIPGFSGHKVALVARDVIEVLQAGDLKHSDPPGGDWLRTIVAESRFSEAARFWPLGKEAEAKAATAHGQEILEGVATSSDRSPVLFYEDIYFEAAQSLLRRSDRRALERHNERIADVLRDPKAPNLMAALRDLAIVHLKLGDHREGLGILAALLRHDTSDPWTFNALALDLPRLGYAAEGRLAAERGLELVRHNDDPDGLAKQLTELLREMGRVEDQSDAPKDATADLRDALRTPFDVNGLGSSRELALRLVPEVATSRVKELPPMPTADALAEMGARLRSLIPGVSSASAVRGTALQAPMVSGTIRRVEPKVGRNESCPCGSGKKFKKCCG